MNEELDEIWAIARNDKNLEKMQHEFGEKIIPIASDLSHISNFKRIEEMLLISNPVVKYLVNNAGIARMVSK